MWCDISCLHCNVRELGPQHEDYYHILLGNEYFRGCPKILIGQQGQEYSLPGYAAAASGAINI